MLIIMHYLNYALCIIISTDEEPRLRIESLAIVNLHGVSTKLHFNLIFTMQSYKELIKCCVYILNCYVRKYDSLTEYLTLFSFNLLVNKCKCGFRFQRLRNMRNLDNGYSCAALCLMQNRRAKRTVTYFKGIQFPFLLYFSDSSRAAQMLLAASAKSVVLYQRK